MKKKVIGISLVLGLIISMWYIGGASFSVFGETGIIYDSMNNVNHDKWEYEVDYYNQCRMTIEDTFGQEAIDDKYKTITYANGQLAISSILHMSNFCPRTLYRTSATSTRAFTTEDLKIKIDWNGRDRKTDSGCNPVPFPQIYFGNQLINVPVIVGAYVGRCANSGAVKAVTAKGTLEIKRYDDLDLAKYVVIWQGEEILLGRNDEPAQLKLAGNIKVDEVRYEPYYSCEIDYETEVVVRDKFLGGSIVGIPTLTYTPKKFCPEDLGVLIFSPAGLTDEKGSITRSIAEGKDIVIPDDQYWQIDYVTNYVDGMKERCNVVGEVYSTEKEKCIQVSQQAIEEEVLISCTENTDCIIPPNCKYTLSECVENVCVYNSTSCDMTQIINYLEVVGTLIIDEPKITKLSEGETTIRFTGDKEILGQMFESYKPRVLYNEDGTGNQQCYVDWDDYVDHDECYEVTANWGEHNMKIIDTQKVELNEFISVSYDQTARGAFRGDKGLPPEDYFYEFVKDSDWANTFEVTLSNIITIEDTKYEEAYKLNSPAVLGMTLKNNIIEDVVGGYRIEITKSMTDKVTSEVSEIIHSNKFEIPLPTDEIGVYTVKVSPYIVLYDNVDYTIEEFSFGYYVSYVEPDQLDLFQKTKVMYDKNKIYLAIFGLIIVIGGIVFTVRKFMKK